MNLAQMKEIDIRTVSADTLVEADDIQIDIESPKLDRMMGFVRRAINPYFFRSGTIVVKIGHADTTLTANDRLESWMRTL